MEENINQPTWNENTLISNSSRIILHKIANWTKFLSIVGFVILGLNALFILSAGAMIDEVNRYMEMRSMYPYTPGVFKWFYAVIYLIIIGLSCIPVFYLYKFSDKTKEALKRNNTKVLTEALKFLNSHYTWVGIFTILGLVFVLSAFLFMIVGLIAYM